MTYVLIHGGGSTARFWDRLVPLLSGPALAVDLPGRGDHPTDLATITVDDEVASVVADVEAAGREQAERANQQAQQPRSGRRHPKDGGPRSDEIVLVAHSSGGLVVPGVVSALGGQVGRIVLNAALVPPEGGCGLDCMQPRHRDGLIAAVEAARGATPITLPGAPEDPERLRSAYGGEPLDDEQLAFISDPIRCVPDTVHHYFQPVRWSTAAAVPVTYVVNDRDRPVPTGLQDDMAARLPQTASLVRLPTGHIPAVTHPHLLAAAVEAPQPI